MCSVIVASSLLSRYEDEVYPPSIFSICLWFFSAIIWFYNEKYVFYCTKGDESFLQM